MLLRHFLTFCIGLSPLLHTALLQAQRVAVTPLRDSIICGDFDYVEWWRDDFDGEQLDTVRWASYYPFGEGGSDACSFCRTHSTADHREYQVFLDENVVVKDGNVSLVVRKQPATWYEFSERFTSGVIYSRPHIRGYWRAEIRAIVPTQKSIWPAFWMFGGITEIDVFEFYGNKRGRQKSLEHYESSVHNWSGNHTAWHDLWTLAAGAQDSFRVYGVDVTPAYIAFRLDGQEVGRFYKFMDSSGVAVTDCTLRAGSTYFIHNDFPAPDAEVSVIAGVGIRRKRAKVPPPMVIDWIGVWRIVPAAPEP